MNPYWLEEPTPARPETKLDGRADVAIVGAGVTGCSAALRLAEGGLRVRVHDARGIAEGASGRNGGFALGGGAARYDVARETYGAERAAAFWRWTHEALDRMAELAGDALRRTGSYRLAGDEEEREGIRLEYEALREDGFEADWLDDVPGGAAGRFHGAISHPHDGSIQPARFVRRLAAAATAAGAEFREHDQVEDLDGARRRSRPRRDRRLRARPRLRARRPRLADPGPDDRERAARPRALRPPALRAPGLRLLAAAARRPDPARRLSRRARSSTS